MRYDIVPITELPQDLLKLWQDRQDASPALCSPFFSPGFAQAVGRQRDDLRVVIITDGSAVSGFLPVHVKTGGCAVPVGGQVNDYQGIIGTAPDAGLRGEGLLARAGLVSYDFNHGLTEHALMADNAFNHATSFRADLRGGLDAWQQEVSRQTSELGKLGRKRRKLEREIGPLRFVPNDPGDAVWDQFLSWKAGALRRLGVANLFDVDWFANLIAELRRTDDPGFGGMFSTLYAGDRLIAAHFGIRSRSAWHWWFPSYDASLSKVSPGLILLVECIEHAASRGMDEIDFGRGTELFKRQFGNRHRALCEGSLERPLNPFGAARAARKATQRLANRVLPGKASDILRRGGNRILRAGLL